jgi:predicted amidophosphoribosyltransferase
MNLQINLNPQEIHGNWQAGYALDFHTVSSRLLPDGTYDTERTEIGELVYQVKYRHDRGKIQPIAEIAAKFVREDFTVTGDLVHRYLNAIIPIPFSDTNRPFQPVPEIAAEIGNLLNRPVRTDYLIRERPTRLIRDLRHEERQAEIQGAFIVQSQDLRGRWVLLFDDLYDSGATLTEVTNVLYEQGRVRHVLVLTLTQTRTRR